MKTEWTLVGKLGQYYVLKNKRSKELKRVKLNTAKQLIGDF